jgi:hypothetical protein
VLWHGPQHIMVAVRRRVFVACLEFQTDPLPGGRLTQN